MLKYIILTTDIIVILFCLLALILGTLTSSLWTTIFWLGVLIVYVNMINNVPHRPKGGDETTRPCSKLPGIIDDNGDDTEIIIY